MGVITRLLRAAGRGDSIQIDPDYSERKGYDAEFLGTGEHAVPLPTLPEDLVAKAATNNLATAEPRYVLPYHHFSVVLSKDRRLAFFTAVNVDGTLEKPVKRAKDHWFFDPRVPKTEQTGDDVYRNNDLDLGHLVRRLDPTWGDTEATAKQANDDTFHFTNCTPQHKDFNRNKTSWAGMEDYILKHAENLGFKVCVFTGPVLAVDDDQYRGVQLPRQFWKVVVMVKRNGNLSATAYLLSQKDLIAGIRAPIPEEFSYAEYRTYQVPVTQIQELTALLFGALPSFDPLAQRNAVAAAPTELARPDDAIL
jgi:endonuclease G, mitochondrial